MERLISSEYQKKGFTLLEVLVSFAILAVLLAAIIQANSNSILMLQKTRHNARVENRVYLELNIVERNLKKELFGSSSGTYRKDAPGLEGYKWQKIISLEHIVGQPIKKITFRILWEENGRKHTFESFILANSPTK